MLDILISLYIEQLHLLENALQKYSMYFELPLTWTLYMYWNAQYCGATSSVIL